MGLTKRKVRAKDFDIYSSRDLRTRVLYNPFPLQRPTNNEGRQW